MAGAPICCEGRSRAARIVQSLSKSDSPWIRSIDFCAASSAVICSERRLIASAKSTHRLVVFDADSGERLREVGSEGAALGQFDRPNGVAVFGDMLFVVERDTHRVQVLSLPSFKPVGSYVSA